MLQESRWLALVVLAGFLSLALFGYSPNDPGWSRAVFTTTLSNPAGRAGAWISDLLLYLFLRAVRLVVGGLVRRHRLVGLPSSRRSARR